MPAQTITEFIDGLTSSRLLDNEQIDEVRRRPETPSGDLSGVGRFLQERGWLTRYQVQEIREGRGTGLSFGGYRILERLGESELGQTFKAFHPALHRPVVLRWIRPEWLQPADSIPDYLRRAQNASLVSHPNLVNVLDAGVMDGVLYVVEDWLDATDLQFFVQEMGALPVPLACEYIRQAALGLQSAHERGIFHGDLHPGRMLLSPIVRIPSQSRPGELNIRPAPGSGVRVSGVGLTPERPPIGEMSMALSRLLGAVEYLAPERITRASADMRSDLYSLGACFYYVLASRSPFGTSSPVEALLQVSQAEPTPIESLRSDLPPAVCELVRRLMSREPRQRPYSAGEVAESLKPFGVATAAPDGEQPPVAIPLASETATQGNPLPAILADHIAGDTPTNPVPGIEALPDHHMANGDNPFGVPIFHDREGTHETEHESAFTTHLEDLPPTPGAGPPKVRQPQKTGNRTWLLVLGALFHLTAIGLLIAWITGAFNRSEPPPPEKQEPVKKKKSKPSGFVPPTINWAALDLRGRDRPHEA